MNQEQLSQIQAWVVEKSADFALNLVSFFLILLIGKFTIGIFRTMIAKVLSKSKNVNEILNDFVLNLSNKAMWVIVLMLALSRIGVDVGPLIAGLGVGGFIAGFAFQETLSNFAAGLMLLINQPFKKGQYIEAGGVAGTVQDLNIMATVLTSPDNKKIVVPNKAIWGSSIINYSAMGTRRVELGMGISYGSDIAKAKEVAMKVLSEIPMILQDPAPQVEVITMADSSVNFVIRPWCKTADYWTVFFNVNHKLKDALDANGITIPFPQMDVHLHQLEK